MKIKIYAISRESLPATPRVKCEVRVFDERGHEERRYPLKHQCHHSPDGFECGYQGSGPADLALSILADVTGEGIKVLQSGFTVGYTLHLSFRDDWLVGSNATTTKELWLASPNIIAWIKMELDRVGIFSEEFNPNEEEPKKEPPPDGDQGMGHADFSYE